MIPCDEVLHHLCHICRADSYKDAEILRHEFKRRYRSLYHKAVQSLEDVGDALFTFFAFPQRHRLHLKTTNPIDSLFATVRLRTQAA
jgi:transposase-like protein